jgi:hypothetical protein
MGLPLLVILLLLLLACVAVKPRTNNMLYGAIACVGVLAAALAVALLTGHVDWGWGPAR